MTVFRSFTSLVFKKPKQVYVLLFSGVVIGGLTGLIGSVFQLAIVYLEKFRSYLLTFGVQNEIWQWGLPIIFTLTCLIVSLLLVRRFAPETAGSGVQEIEGTLSEKRTLKWHRVLPVKFIGGILSLSGGMVAGREGPTIQMGGAIGEMLSKKFRIEPGFAHTFIAAGAAAGLSAAFNAPLAGILFVIEEMRPHFKYSFMSMQCVILASVASAIVLRMIMGAQPDIPMMVFIQPPIASIWLFVIFGCIFGIMGVIFNKYLLKTLDYFTYRKPKIYWANIVLVGIVVGVLTKAYPEVIGGGYAVIPQALKMQLPLLSLILIFFIRVGTTWTCYGTGMPGGIFAPMLALGTTFGMWFGHYAYMFFPDMISHPGIFAVAGMSALFTATVGAPLTGIILVAEMTSNYNLLLPLILTCFSATIVSYLLGGTPIYESLLVRTLRIAKEKGERILLNKEKPSQRKIRKHHPTKD